MRAFFLLDGLLQDFCTVQTMNIVAVRFSHAEQLSVGTGNIDTASVPWAPRVVWLHVVRQGP